MSEPWGQPSQQSGGDWSVPQGGGESGSFAPPPVDPQYGAPQHAGQQPQPQYGAPQQPAPQFGAPAPQYGDPQFGGQPGYGGPAGPGGYGGYVPPEYQKNGFAVAGLILFFTVVLGLIFSILGLVKSGKVGGKGRGLAIAGLILSILAGVGYGVGIAAAAKSTVFDPGCNSMRSSFNSLISKLQTDVTKMSSDSSDQTAMQADVTAFTADIQTMKNDLDDALAKAQHQSVKDKLQVMDTDVTTVLTGLKAAESGDTSQLTATQAAAGRLQADGSSVDSVCSL